MACEIHQSDIGTIFELSITDCDDLAVDITNATDIKVIFSKPAGTVETKTVTPYGDGTNGIVRYTTIEDDLDQTGKYKLQAKVTLPTGTFSSNITSFRVYANL